MSRHRDLLHINQQITALLQAREKIQKDYQELQQGYADKVSDILTKAGIKDEVDGLNIELEQHRQKAQQEADVLTGKIADAQKIGQYLMGRDKVDPDTPHIVEGIDINKLGFETRAKVLSGDQDTIKHLQDAQAAREAEAKKAEAGEEKPAEPKKAAPAKKKPATKRTRSRKRGPAPA